MNKKSKILSTTINKNTSMLMDDFNSSIDIDKRLIEEDIAVTSAHVKALTKLKIISKNHFLDPNFDFWKSKIKLCFWEIQN